MGIYSTRNSDFALKLFDTIAYICICRHRLIFPKSFLHEKLFHEYHANTAPDSFIHNDLYVDECNLKSHKPIGKVVWVAEMANRLKIPHIKHFPCVNVQFCFSLPIAPDPNDKNPAVKHFFSHSINKTVQSFLSTHNGSNFNVFFHFYSFALI